MRTTMKVVLLRELTIIMWSMGMVQRSGAILRIGGASQAKDSSAFFYSLVETCKAMDISANDYLTHLFMNANTIKDGDEEAWTAMLPGRCEISAVKGYKERLLAAMPDPDRTEPYRLRGKRV